jgi:hypothetical protein
MTNLLACQAIFFLLFAFLATSAFADCTFKSGTSEQSVCPCKTEDQQCKPWLTSGCNVGSQMKLIFALDKAQENYNVTVGNRTVERVSYRFCPIVDQFEAFNLNLAGVIAATNRSGNQPGHPAVTSFFEPSYVSAYGFGTSSDTTNFTNLTDSTVVLAKRDATLCPSTKPIAFTPFLILNITLKSGLFNYVTNFDQAIQTGFAPTCNADDLCLMTGGGSDYVCLGNTPGKKNCAKCVGDNDDATNWNTAVFAAFFGTDASGRRLMSGSSSPLAFQQFAAAPFITSAVNKIQGSI